MEVKQDNEYNEIEQDEEYNDEEIHEDDPYILDFRFKEPEELHFPWHELFKNNNPIQYEIGPGKGEFLIGLAQAHPEKNFIGIEIRRKRAVLVQNKALRAELSNVQMILGNAKEISEHIFPAGSVETIYVHFPDPWPKKRHIRRRLVDSQFAEIVYKILVPNGKIYLSTDVETYSVTMFEAFSNHSGFKNIYFTENTCPCPEFHNTVHESKFRQWGRNIHYLLFEKCN